MPACKPATVQLLYRIGHQDGERLVVDPRTGATAYTGSRSAGLELKTSADAAGKPICLELSSVNPVVVLPGVLAERGDEIAAEFAASCLLGTGQFCTNPGLVVLLAGVAFHRRRQATVRSGGGHSLAVLGRSAVAVREPEGPSAGARRSSPAALPPPDPGTASPIPF